jgi:glycerophosphoryl diester phosphodiesterase
MTADGELIVLHDRTLERTSNVTDVFPARRPWFVHEFRLDEIRLLDFGSWFMERDPFGQIAAGLVRESDLGDYVGERVPTLREVLTFTLEHGRQINIEIKDLSGSPGHSQVVAKVISLVEELNMVDLVLVSSFNQNYLAQVRETHSKIATALLVSKPDPQAHDVLRKLGAQAYHPRKTAIGAAEVSLLNRKGFRVHVWNVNDQKTMRRLVEYGVSGIFTDFPQVLASFLSDFDGAMDGSGAAD